MATTKTILLTITVALVASPAWSDELTSSQTINRASQLLVDGKVDEAIAAYEQAAKGIRQSDELTYNLGVAAYRKGDLPRARALFQQAMNSTDRSIAAKASFNLGNCDYSEALAVSEENYRESIEKLNEAINHYRTSLRIDPRDTDARQNIELALRLIDQLTNQPPSKQDENEDKENEDRENESGEDQNEEKQEDKPSDQENSSRDGDESSDSKDEKEGDQQEPNSGDSQQQDNQQQEKDSQQQSADGEEQSGQDQSQSTESEQDPKGSESQSGESADDEKPQPEPNPESGQQTESGQTQDPEDDKDSAGSAQQGDDSEPQQPLASGSSGTSADGQPIGKMDKQQAMRLLQAIRDRDLMRRMEKLRNANRQFIPVERDW